MFYKKKAAEQTYIPVFRIHDILVWIRIRILGSMPLTNGSGFRSGSGCESFYFHHWPSSCQQKTNWFKKVFRYITFLRYLYIIFKDKKSKRCQKTVEQGFSYYICLMIVGSGSGSRAGSGSGSIPLTNGSESGCGRPKNTWIRIRNTATYCKFKKIIVGNVINQYRKIITVFFKHVKRESLPLRSCLDRKRTSLGVGAVPPPPAQAAHHNRAPAAHRDHVFVLSAVT